MKKILNTILEYIIPSNCIGCGQRGSLCCELCLLSAPHPERDLPPDIRAGYDYRDERMIKFLWSLKYYGKRNLGRALGGALYERLIEDISEIRSLYGGAQILLVPIPLSKKRRKERGFNQAELIARGIAEVSKEKIFIVAPKLVEKIKNTLPQAKIKDRNKRLKNVKNCFQIRSDIDPEEKIRGKIIIVVDDITTTGGTLHEVMSVLKKSGAKKVLGFAVAH